MPSLETHILLGHGSDISEPRCPDPTNSELVDELRVSYFTDFVSFDWFFLLARIFEYFETPAKKEGRPRL